MPRIPAAAIAHLKQSVSVKTLAEQAGVVLKPAGAGEWRGCCPFHDDREPSLSINERTNVFHCFGCGAKGDVIGWVRQRDGVSFPDAVAWLVAQERGEALPLTPQRRLGRSDAALPDDVQGADLVAAVVAYYAQVLHDDPLATAAPAREYLIGRKLWVPDVLRGLSIGFDDRSLGTRLPIKALVAGKRIRERLTDVGLYRATGHAHFVGCITCPIEMVDAHGKIIENVVEIRNAAAMPTWASVYGRRAQKAKDGVRHVNLPGERRGVWNASGCAAAAAARDGVIILCEAVFDALTFVLHGFPNATACLGVNGYTDDVRQFLHAHAQEVVIAFDRDAAAEASFPAVADDLIKAGITVRRLQFPPGQDANAVAMAAEDPADVLGEYVRSAVWLGGAAKVAVSADLSAFAVSAIPALEKTVSVPTAAAEEKRSVVESVKAPALATLATAPTADLSSLAAENTAAKNDGLPINITQPSDDVVQAVCGDRLWTARGWRANTSYDRLRVALRLQRGPRLCGDTVDLASMKARSAFIAAAAAECDVLPDVVKDDVGRLWLALEYLQDRRIRDAATPVAKPNPVTQMPDERRQAALEFLKAPDLLARIRADIAQCGLVGESDNALVAYVAAVSRKLPDPLAVLVQASSAAGKSSLQDAVLSLIPDSDRYDLTAISSRALFYAEPDALRHKALSIAEQEGAEAATYSLKLMQSAGKLSIMVPVKNPDTNEMTTQSRTVEGPVAIFMTTTAAELDDELQNRFLVLTVDESAEQTAAVQHAQRQRETLAGFRARAEAAAIRQRHHDAQHLLDGVAVVNPFADRLTFSGRTPRTRRDHAKYLRIIRAVTLLHQHQRVTKTAIIAGQAEPVTYIETTLADIQAANGLAAAVLGRSLDELGPPTRRLLETLRTLTQARAHLTGKRRDEIRLTRREIRDHTGWSPVSVHRHLARLVDLEYVQASKGGITSSQIYAVIWDGEGRAGDRFCLGLTDLNPHTCPYDGKDSTPDGKDSTRIPPVFQGVSTRIPGDEIDESDGEISAFDELPENAPENAYRDPVIADVVPVLADHGMGGFGTLLRSVRLAPLSVWA